MSSKLDALRAQYSETPRDGNRESFTNNYYPFWDMEVGQRAVLRFLPDADGSNPRMFMVEKISHNLVINGQKRTVPCMSMYGEDCPVCKVSQDYYKVDDKENGKRYWKKKQYIAQALVVEDPLPADAKTGETHQGQVRNIAIGYQLYNIIKEALASEDDPLDEVPFDFAQGYDFVIKKTQQGQYASYATGTKFQSRPRALSEAEIAGVEGSIIDLKTLLPKNLGVDKVRAMLNADLNGEDYQEEGGRASTPAAAPAPRVAAAAPAPEPKVAPKTTPLDGDSTESSSEVDAMLAQIRQRRQQAK